jgi:hypothetical protein
MANLDEAFGNYITSQSSPHSPVYSRNNNNNNNYYYEQQSEWIQPKQQIINDGVTAEQAAAQIAHQHRFQPNELRLVAEGPSTHWCFIRYPSGAEYCYPKRFNWRADD